MRSVPLTTAKTRRQDCVVILTNHSNIDYDALLREAPLIVDTRNQYGQRAVPAGRVVKL